MSALVEFRLRRTVTPYIFTIQVRQFTVWEDRATLVLGPQMSPEQVEKWRRYVEACLNSGAWGQLRKSSLVEEMIDESS